MENYFDDTRKVAIIEAAGHYLSDQEEGDLCDAYIKLIEACEGGYGESDPASFDVFVWDQLRAMSVKELADLIEAGADNLETLFKDMTPIPFIPNIDWELLKKQKLALLEITAKDIPSTSQMEAIAGIIHLLDDMQDYAVDVMGVPESKVMLSEEDS
jgi:hypothetical protein